MRAVFIFSGFAMLALSACDVPPAGNGSPAVGVISNVPEGVRTLADPFQDLSVVRINPEDGCYEYRHTGPVETTFLPIRTPKGNPVCSR